MTASPKPCSCLWLEVGDFEGEFLSRREAVNEFGERKLAGRDARFVFLIAQAGVEFEALVVGGGNVAGDHWRRGEGGAGRKSEERKCKAASSKEAPHPGPLPRAERE